MLRDQLGDYQHRGVELDNFSFMDFLLRTYDSRGSDQSDDDLEDTRRGPYLNNRVQYQDNWRPGHNRVVRRTNNETLPHFIGRWFPRNDKADIRPLYCAAVLMLLNPWRSLTNLKASTETFEYAFQRFLATCSERHRHVLDNLQFYYISRDMARARKRHEEQMLPQGFIRVGGIDEGIESQQELQLEQLLVNVFLNFISILSNDVSFKFV